MKTTAMLVGVFQAVLLGTASVSATSWMDVAPLDAATVVVPTSDPSAVTDAPVAATDAPTTPAPTEATPAGPVTTCSMQVFSKAIQTNKALLQCGLDSGYSFLSAVAPPNADQLAKMAKSTSCVDGVALALESNPAECILPIGGLYLRTDVLDRISTYIKTGVITAPSTKAPPPVPVVPVPTPAPAPIPAPAPTTSSPLCTQAVLAPVMSPTADTIKCSKDAGFPLAPPARPTPDQLTKICASEACVKVFAAASAANPTECTIPFGTRIQYRADLLNLVASSCSLATPTPTTPVPTTTAPTSPVPTTTAPATPEPSTTLPATPVPTTPVPTTPCPPITSKPDTPAPTTCAPITSKPDTPAPTTPLPTTPAPTGPVGACDVNLVSKLIYKDADFVKCGADVGYPFVGATSAPSGAQMDKMCANPTCKKAFADALATNPAECVIPLGKLKLRGDLLDRVTSYCLNPVLPSPAPTTVAPTPAPVPTTQPPTPGPVPTPISPICTQAVLAPVIVPTPDTLKCSKDSGFPLMPPTRPSAEQLTKICGSDACVKVFAAAVAANPAECTVPFGPRIQYRADFLDLVATTCSLKTPAPTTPVPTTTAPATPVPTTTAPATPVPTTTAPATPVPTTTAPATPVPTTTAPATPVPTTTAPATPEPTTTAPATPEPTTPVPTTASPVAPGGRCGDSKTGPLPCSGDEYCQPWDPWFYQCRRIDAKCGKQEVNVDFFGDDLMNLSVLLPEQCCDKCHATPGCKAYTFVNYNADGKPRCYLKKGTGEKRAVVGAVSASIKASSDCSTPVNGQCGNDRDGAQCCPSGQYCQPWDSWFYQCRAVPQKCAKQEVGVDYFGNDLFKISGILPEQCCDKCAETPGCKAYTFVNLNPDGKSACYLKSAVGDKRTKVGAVSAAVSDPKPDPPVCSTPVYGNCGNAKDGAKCCPSSQYCQPWNTVFFQCMPTPAKCSQQYTGVDFFGDDIGRVLGLKDSAACCAKCSSTGGCKAYTFVNDAPGGQPACYLKRGMGQRRAAATAVSGVVN